jgi:hypothetical protein
VPDVQLRPIGEREDANAFARTDAAVEQAPQLGALVLWIPLPGTVAKGEDALLGARLLFIAARASKGRIKAMRA